MPLDGSEFKFEIDETTKLLIAARERIERGWCQGRFARGSRVCAIGALTRGHEWREFDDPQAIHKASQRLTQAIGGSFIPAWNDAPERTQTDVLAAFDRAIAASLSGSA